MINGFRQKLRRLVSLGYTLDNISEEINANEKILYMILSKRFINNTEVRKKITNFEQFYKKHKNKRKKSYK